MIGSRIQDRARYWNVTAQERAASYPCDAHAEPPYEDVLRAIDVAAPPPVVFRWLCQLKVAPYSFDLLDNAGRRSPRELTPGADELERGQELLVFELVEFERDRHLTGVVQPKARRFYGPLAVSYVVEPAGAAGSRLIVKLCAGRGGALARLRATLLTWGDLVMMRKQLRTLKRLAEASAAA